ncbi:hypothetical protein [Shewanella surugensis]|uniref:Uncharacterized protein n=1 Tax=Shewanella surugensis TaxID=212020 RepID=A0ABT0LDB3_9GAMM|nr:hypothetical protein [Shewanella surugensis]MCL1125683.1 hypothetical protein [Shewanella surugensis]
MKKIKKIVYSLAIVPLLFQWPVVAKTAERQDKTMALDNMKGNINLAVDNAGSGLGDDHLHVKKAVPAGVVVPKLDLQLFVDHKSGYNLHIIYDYDGFELEPPEFLDKPKGIIEGHAHLFINGKKIQRVYGAYLHLDAKLFKLGINSISVTLNSHQHDTWSVDGKPIVATYFINTQVTPVIQYYFSAFPM